MSLLDVTLGMPFWWFAARCCLTLLSSSVASDFQGFLQRFDCVGSMFKLGQMLKAASSSGVAPSFKKREFQAESRERAAGSQYFRPEISVPPTRCSSNERVPVDGAPPTRLIFHAVNPLV